MTNIGLSSTLVEVEVDLFNGVPKFFVVGLGDAAIQESRQRVRSAIKNSGFIFPAKVINVNLAPADIRKAGPSFDLAIAIGILLATEQIDQLEIFKESIFVGELALDGSLRHTNGILPIVACALEYGFKKIFLPKINAEEASMIPGIEVYGANNLAELVGFIQGYRDIKPREALDFDQLLASEQILIDFKNIKGQSQGKRALEIAAAGAHNVLMNGAPGAGKTLMARALAGILPKLTYQEALEVTKVFSIANKLTAGQSIITTRQFRTIHHTASSISIVGGGNVPRPGEISLAHRGVLFLDEVAEFPSQTLEVLRQPLEDRQISISRAQGSSVFPAHFTLIAAMNPCPCGYYNIPKSPKDCTCNPGQISRYQKKLSGPFLDRFDLFVDIAPVKIEKLQDSTPAEESLKIRERVQNARNLQTERFQKEAITTNSEMGVRQIEKHCPLNSESQAFLKEAIQKYQLSARGYHRILKVSRTIADLEAQAEISLKNLAEALQLRQKVAAT